MKTLTKKFICSILYYFGLVNFIIKIFIPKRKKLPVVILIYHRITQNTAREINPNLTINHPFHNFSKEMSFLKKWFNVVTLDRAVEIIRNKEKTDRPTIAITFDDGFEDNFRLAYPILKKFNIPATVFLTTGFIGTNSVPWVEKIGQAILQTKEKQLQLNSYFDNATFSLRTIHDKQDAFGNITTRLKELNYPERIQLVDEIIRKLGASVNGHLRMLNWQEVQEMSRANITFGSHTMSHPILSKMPIELAKAEIQHSKLLLEKKIGSKIKHFAFPNGRIEDFTEELKQYCKDLGFESISTAVYGNNRLEGDIYSLNRVSPGRNIPIFAVDLTRAFLRN